MTKLETVLWKLYIHGDPRISVLESFQNDPYTYVKVFVDDGTHGITVQEITKYTHKLDAMKEAMQSALKKAANLITEHMLAPVIAELTCDPV